jgi:hypothetical protein
MHVYADHTIMVVMMVCQGCPALLLVASPTQGLVAGCCSSTHEDPAGCQVARRMCTASRCYPCYQHLNLMLPERKKERWKLDMCVFQLFLINHSKKGDKLIS